MPRCGTLIAYLFPVSIPKMNKTLRIATRKSPLALWQAHYVSELITRNHPSIQGELVSMRTTGDKLLDAPLAKVGGKGLFVKELENALLDGRADIAVHSMKDVPVELPDGLHIAVVLERGDPFDALVSTHHASLTDLPLGARVGTSSLRRRCQLAGVRPDLDIRNLRGSVQTRLEKLDNGDFDAIVLAGAGLKRLGMGDRIAQALAPEHMLPAIGQGTLGIECREGDDEVLSCIAQLNHPPTALRLTAERALNAGLNGGCQVPIAGFAELNGDSLSLRGLVARLDGSETLREQANVPAQQAEQLGSEIANALLARGAGDILREAYEAE